MDFLNNLTKLQKSLLAAIVGIIVYVVSASISYSAFSGNSPLNVGTASNTALPTANSTTGESPTEPKTESCPLNGTMHTKEAKDAWSKRRPLAVMIENHEDARPQSGVSSADIVYETVAEGGITRFMALFYCNSLADVQVGPVRSARTYFLDWLSEYDALYAHVGGANDSAHGPADALGQIITYGIKDLNQFSIGFPTYWRDYQRLGRTVATEHTMYSTTQKLWTVGAQRGWTNVDAATGKAWDASFVTWNFKDPSSKGTTAKILVPFWSSSDDYEVQWNYDSSCNCYKRTQFTNNAPAPHIDFDNKQQLSPTNVVVQFETQAHANDGYENNVHLLYGTIGTGKALIFQDGKAIVGTWSKKSRTSREQFSDQSGKPIAFDKGQIWIETVPDGSNVTY